MEVVRASALLHCTVVWHCMGGERRCYVAYSDGLLDAVTGRGCIVCGDRNCIESGGLDICTKVEMFILHYF